ncbi:ubiquitin domain-containing protein 7sl RNA1-related [Anaeramoeba flamelloides]|uniref:Ubiquitin domain-containing protein 7sl RNA1-related n=1 Tax=Anaeramoeba flamelloides TaxID=1746091 RepID=A0AAV8A9B9_9EUKA|nr:ubiquitin domain-containing protein 7sl RNA1-related [Anaeramoeba flamelloides]
MISIQVQLLTKSTKVEISKKGTIGDLKKKIEKNEGISVKNQKLVFQGTTLDDKQLIEKLNMTKSSTIGLIYQHPKANNKINNKNKASKTDKKGCLYYDWIGKNFSVHSKNL